MSCDGSSAKSYIRHATEKARLDNLAFASFPEDYLPYANAAAGHSRASAPPPYLLWGDDRRRRPKPKRRKPKCAGALLCAIALVVLAILAVVAISVYLGVVTNLFRSPVLSVSGRFTASEEFSLELLDSSSSKFLEKADAYKSKVEKAFISSAIEPAFIAARVYSFRPGLVVFFRVYLDRRKLKDEGETPPTELVRELVAQKLTPDPESVQVEENEELLSVDMGHVETTRPPLIPTSKSPKQNGHQRPPNSGVGLWRPVPIEDSVKPSFADGSPGGSGLVRSPEEISIRNPTEGVGSKRVLEESPTNIQQPSSGNKNEGIGSVKVLEESPPKNSQPGNTRDNTGSVRLLDEISPRNPVLQKEGGTSPASSSGKPPGGSPIRPSNQREGIGTVRILDESPPKVPQLTGNIGIGSVSILEDSFQGAPKVPENLREGVGSVRVIDESPLQIPKAPKSSQGGVGLVRAIEDTPPKIPFGNPPEEVVRSMEQPPTLSPSVSLVVRNRSRSERPKSFPTRLAKIQQNGDILKSQIVGAGSIREIIPEESLPLRLQRESQIIASPLSDSDRKGMSSAITPENYPEINNEKMSLVDIKREDLDISTEISTEAQNESEHDSQNETEDSTPNNSSLTEIISVTDNPSSKPSETTVEVTTSQSQLHDIKVTPLENILFNLTRNSLTTLEVNILDNSTTDTTTETVLHGDYITEEDKFIESSDNTSNTVSNNTSFENGSESSLTTNSAEDIHSSIVNYSQYLFHEPHYHTIENERNNSFEDSFEAHTLEGHGFHKPSVSTSVVTPLKTSNVDTTSQMPTTSTISSSTPAFSLDKLDDEVKDSINVSNTHTDSVTEFIEFPNSTEISRNSSHDYEDWSEGDDVGNVTTDDASQQAKIVPQFSSDFLSNDIGEEQKSDGETNGHNNEILRHITTLRPQVNGSDLVVKSCSPGTVPCDASGEKCGVRCDLRRDCPNNVDEAGCTCSDLLRAMGQSQKICDGVDDCSDGSDEARCPWCPSEDYFVCPGSRACVHLNQVCDGKDDCPGGQDEKRCVSLANSSIEAETFEYRPEGYLIVRKNGRWGKLCLDTLTESSDLKRRIADLGKAVCSALTYKNMSSSTRSRDNSESEDSYYQISTEPVNNRSSASSLFESTSCNGKEVLTVKCMTLECGLRPSVTTQRRRIVGGRSVDGAGSWPWAAALYREGEFQCGGALINDVWIVSAAHCFYSSQNAYWSVRLGVLRRGSELRSGGEHVRQIQNIILHPEYEDTGFINDISLLKMDRPVPFSDMLRPICLPSSPKEDATLWHGERCSVVGWGKLHEIGHTFPDTLQEVRLPVISSAECQRRSIFLPAYHITSKMFCAGYERGGRDACLGDSGGPMACQRSSDGRWILLGVTSNGDGCGRPGRPGVYSQVSGFLTWIQKTMSEQKDSHGNVSSESLCTGVRCRLGRCIQKARVCDGRRDCAGGEDEENC